MAICTLFATNRLAEHTVLYFPASDGTTSEGYLHIINHSDEEGELSITAIDDFGNRLEAIVLTLKAEEALDFSASEIEPAEKNDDTNDSTERRRNWRLEISSELPIEVLSFMRDANGAMTPIHEGVPLIAHRHRIPVFYVGDPNSSNSVLRVVNQKDESVIVEISATDKTKRKAKASVRIPGAHTLHIQGADLREGETPQSWPEESELVGAIDLDEGMWQVDVEVASNQSIAVVHLLKSKNDQQVDLSVNETQWWRGVVVKPEYRCAGNDYIRNDYGVRYRSKKNEILEALGGNFGPYTGKCFDDEDAVEIDHIVALAEAHESGMCTEEDIERKKEFGADLLNLTLASREINRQKSSKDALEWQPENENKCWFANRVLEVKQKYKLTVDNDEAAALAEILKNCKSTDLVVSNCSD